MEPYQITIDYHPNKTDMDTVRMGIIDFNDAALHYKSKLLCIFLKDSEKKIHGGILTWLDSDSIYIDILWIDEKLRGQGYGEKLLQSAENEGRKNGCHFCTLDTFEFQAEGFYLKNGYERMGEIKNYIRTYSRIFLRKNLI